MGDAITPPVRHTLFEQLLKQAGIVITPHASQTSKTKFDGPRALTSWEELIENLVSCK